MGLLALPRRSDFEPPVLGGADGTEVLPDWELLRQALLVQHVPVDAAAPESMGSSTRGGGEAEGEAEPRRDLRAAGFRMELVATLPGDPHDIDIVTVGW